MSVFARLLRLLVFVWIFGGGVLADAKPRQVLTASESRQGDTADKRVSGEIFANLALPQLLSLIHI